MDDGTGGVDRGSPALRGVDPGVSFALPVRRRLGAGLCEELGVRRVGDRGAVDLEGGQLDRVAAALVVIGEAAVGGPDLVLPASIAIVSGPRGGRLGDGPVDSSSS